MECPPPDVMPGSDMATQRRERMPQIDGLENGVNA